MEQHVVKTSMDAERRRHNIKQKLTQIIFMDNHFIRYCFLDVYTMEQKYPLFASWISSQNNNTTITIESKFIISKHLTGSQNKYTPIPYIQQFLLFFMLASMEFIQELPYKEYYFTVHPGSEKELILKESGISWSREDEKVVKVNVSMFAENDSKTVHNAYKFPRLTDFVLVDRQITSVGKVIFVRLDDYTTMNAIPLYEKIENRVCEVDAFEYSNREHTEMIEETKYNKRQRSK
jgi:hypothetical protein